MHVVLSGTVAPGTTSSAAACAKLCTADEDCAAFHFQSNGGCVGYREGSWLSEPKSSTGYKSYLRCPPPPPGLPPSAYFTPACKEALTGEYGKDYQGCQTRTRSGHTCANWITAQKDPRTQWGGDHNFCRNPNGAAGGIWCYLAEPTKTQRTETCEPLSAASPPSPPPAPPAPAPANGAAERFAQAAADAAADTVSTKGVIGQCALGTFLLAACRAPFLAARHRDAHIQ